MQNNLAWVHANNHTATADEHYSGTNITADYSVNANIAEGRIYGDTKHIPPDHTYTSYSGTNGVAVDSTVKQPIKGVRLQGRTVWPKNLINLNDFISDNTYVEGNRLYFTGDADISVTIPIAPNKTYTLYGTCNYQPEIWRDTSYVTSNTVAQAFFTSNKATVIRIKFNADGAGNTDTYWDNLMLVEGAYTAATLPVETIFNPYSVNNPTVTVCGKNVLPVPVFTPPKNLANLISVSNGDNIYNFKCASPHTWPFVQSQLFQLKKNTAYTLCYKCRANIAAENANFGVRIFENMNISDYLRQLGIHRFKYTDITEESGHVLTFTTRDIAKIYVQIDLTWGVAGDYDVDVWDLCIVEGTYTDDTMPPYEPYTGNTITLPYTIRSNGDIHDTIDTFLNQHIQRIADDGTMLDTPIITDITDDYSLHGYDGYTNIIVTDDNSCDIDFDAIAATAGQPERPDLYNVFTIQSVENPTVTTRGLNLFDVEDAVAKTPTATYVDGVLHASGDFNYYIDLDPNKTYTVYAETMEGDKSPNRPDLSCLLVKTYDQSGKQKAEKYWGIKKNTWTISGYYRLGLHYTWAYPIRQVYFNARDIMILEGIYTLNTVPPFEPYHAPVSVTLPVTLHGLKDTDGNYVSRDYIDLATGEIVREYAHVIRDDLKWADWGNNGMSRMHGFSPDCKVWTRAVCNIAEFRYRAPLYYDDLIGTISDIPGLYWYVDAAKMGMTRTETRDYANTVLKKYLSLYPMAAVYERGTPVTEKIDIPSVPSFYPTTVIECRDDNNNNVDMDLKIKKLKEGKNYG